jgi:hypothetical protein
MTKSARGGTGGGGRKGRGGGKAGNRAKASQDAPVQPEAPSDPNDWVVVCVGCLRIKRDGVWTDEKVFSRAGRSTGYCDACVAKRRDELRIDRK